MSTARSDLHVTREASSAEYTSAATVISFGSLTPAQQLRAWAEVVQNSPIGVAVLDYQLRFVYVNPALSTMNGIAAGEHIGKPIEAVLPDIYAKCGARLRQVVATHTGVFDDLIAGETPATPGKIRYWLQSWYPIDCDSQEPLIAASIREITEERQMLEALAQAETHSEQFLETVAHELKTPLSTIGNITHLLMHLGISSAEKLGAMLDRQVTHLTRLVADLSDAKAIKHGRITYKDELFSARECILSSLECCASCFQAKNIELDVALSGNDVLLRGDSDRLTQVICNLLSNAAKYTQSGGRVSIESNESQSELVIHVRDTGIGFSPSEADHIFERYGRTEEGRRAASGMGIGLWLSKQIVEHHGGTLTGHSGGRLLGSTFELRLPLTR